MIERDGEWLLLQGSLTMETVPAIFDTGLQQLATQDLKVDFSRVATIDSAAVSMLLGWARAARRMRHDLQVKGLPGDLLSLAKLYGVAELLPQQTD